MILYNHICLHVCYNDFSHRRISVGGLECSHSSAAPAACGAPKRAPRPPAPTVTPPTASGDRNFPMQQPPLYLSYHFSIFITLFQSLFFYFKFIYIRDITILSKLFSPFSQEMKFSPYTPKVPSSPNVWQNIFWARFPPIYNKPGVTF